MRKTILLASAIALLSQPAFAQLQSTVVAGSDNGTTRRILKTDATGRLEVVGAAAGGVVYGPDAEDAPPTQSPLQIACIYRAAPPTVTTGDVVRVACDANGKLETTIGGGGSIAVTQSTSPWVVGQATAANFNARVVGVDADDAAQTENRPVAVGGIYNSTLPTYTAGDRVQHQYDPRGNLRVRLAGEITGVSSTYASMSLVQRYDVNTGNNFPLATAELSYDGTNVVPARTVTGASASDGVGVRATANIPNNSANIAITPAVSSTTEGSKVLCSAACNFYGVAVTTSSTYGWMMLFNATSAPADGAVTPILCRPIAANTTVEVDRGTIPDRYSTGVTAVFSTTGCFVKTISTTAMFEGRIKQ